MKTNCQRIAEALTGVERKLEGLPPGATMEPRAARPG